MADGNSTTPDARRGGEVPRSRPAQLARALLPVGAVLGTISGLHLYIGSRLVGRAGLPLRAEVLGWAVLAALFLNIPLSFYLRRRSREGFARASQAVAHLWIGTFGILITVVLAADLARVLYGALVHGAFASAAAAGRTEAVGIVGSVIPLVAWSVFTARGRARIERVKVPIANLPAGLEGLRIAQISDMHIGESLKGDFLARVVAQVNALGADLVTVTGDLVDGSVRELREDVKPLAQLTAPLGVFYVTGNHEYYWGAPSWEAEVRRLGLTVLHNEHRIVERGGDRLVVGGVTDYNGASFGPAHASRPDLAFAGAPEGVPRVLLAHQPRSATEAAKAGVALQLSGHTHGGQIFPFNFFVRLQQPTVRGLDRVLGLWLYTHRGTGYWGPPMRLGPSPEIAELTLTLA